MTTGRINQVATTRFSLLVPDFFFSGNRTRFAGGCGMFDCVLASVSQLSCTTGPFRRQRPGPLSQPRAPPEKRPLPCQRFEIYISIRNTAELRYGHESLTRRQWTELLIHTTPQGYGRPHRGGRHSVWKQKKETQTRKFVNQKIAQRHLDKQQTPFWTREVTKQRRETKKCKN